MILILLIVFAVLFLIVGGDRGVVSLVTLAGNILTFLLAIYLMAKGINPILITLLASFVINCITLFYQNGKNEKTAAAFISVVIITLGMLLVMLFSFGRMHLNGLNEIELGGDLTLYYNFSVNINMQQVMLCVIIICFLGAIMDTAMAVSSALFEVHDNNPQLNEHELFKSGMTIGKDILNTTINTLFFAYCGEALLLFLYFRKYNYSFTTIINSKAFLLELLTILMSAVGCVMIIPLCARVTALIIKTMNDNGEKSS